MKFNKTILITNDDGFNSLGLKALMEALCKIANIITVAPSREKSASGHSLTLTNPLKFMEIDKNFYSLEDGTPSDCIFLSLATMFKNKKPDLVISGINKGSNMGEDITYSGTAAAAMESVLQGVPAIAISQIYKNSNEVDIFGYDLAKQTIVDIVIKIFNNFFPLPKRKFLNINIPPIKPKECNGIKVTKAGYRKYNMNFSKNTTPRGKEYFWIGVHPLGWEKTDNILSDFEACENNFISISPIKLDMTSYEDLKYLENYLKKE